MGVPASSPAWQYGVLFQWDIDAKQNGWREDIHLGPSGDAGVSERHHWKWEGGVHFFLECLPYARKTKCSATLIDFEVKAKFTAQK